MEAKDVRSLPWIPVKDWSRLTATHERIDICSKTKKINGLIGLRDVEVFVKSIYRECARELNISYDELLPILKEENQAFDLLKGQIYKTYIGYYHCDEALKKLKATLRIPDTSKIKEAATKDNVSACLEMFKKLSDVEKMVFLQKIGKINVKIEYSAAETTTVE